MNIQAKKILLALFNKPFVKTSALKVMAAQYNARIYELRKAGYKIVSRKEKDKYGFALLNVSRKTH